ALLPWALHHRHAIRVPVQVLLHVVLERHGPLACSPGGDAGDMGLLQQVSSGH
ncbi:SpoU_methylase domain-containing protein, partial [Haematococcus lacustris]